MDYNHDSSQAFPVKDEEQQFNRLKAQLHEQLIGGMNCRWSAPSNPAGSARSLRRGAEELCQNHAGLSARPTANG